VVQAPLAIVWSCALGVSAYAAAGRLVEVPEQVCPSCGGRLSWWSGYWRKLRESGVRVRIWVRRGRCPQCDATHALLPDFVVERRRYAVETIGHVFEVTAARVSAWKSSEALDLPFATVRDWRKRCRERAPEQLAELSQLALKVGAEIKELPTPPLAALLAVLKVVWARTLEREPGLAGLWRFWNAVFSGKGLAPNTEPGLA
jgi:Domain of unknown function (DUF6431)